MYDFLSPFNEKLPYVYDNFRWAHCDKEGFTFGAQNPRQRIEREEKPAGAGNHLAGKAALPLPFAAAVIGLEHVSCFAVLMEGRPDSLSVVVPLALQ